MTFIFISEHFYGPLAYFGSIYFELPQVAAACSGKNLKGFPILPLFHTFKVIFMLIIGIYYDISLIQFLLKRKKTIEPGKYVISINENFIR